MSKLSILHLYPETLKLNGEFGNVLALQVRSEARGIASEIVRNELAEPLPKSRPDIMFLGSGTLSAMKLAGNDLASKSKRIHEWVASGTKVLAVGAGFDLISKEIEYPDGALVTGLGLTDTRHKITAEHRVGEVLVGESLAGFINTNRKIVRDGISEPIGVVTSSDEPALVGYVDGFFDGSVMASNIQGPLLPMNPGLADRILAGVFPDIVWDESIQPYDSLATSARQAISLRVNG